MAKMSELVHELADTLGEDTASLEFRVGLHSGPVVAGVLRTFFALCLAMCSVSLVSC